MTGNRASAIRWGACFTLVLGLHIGGAAALVGRWQNDGDSLPNAPVVMLELAPLAVAPSIVPNDIPPGPESAEAQAEPDPVKPIEMAELPPAPQPEVALTPPPKQVEKPKEKPKQKRATVASAPSSAEHRAERAAAPTPGANSRDPNAVPSWRSALQARLRQFKRYPPESLSRGEHGILHLSFSIDRNGGAHNIRVVRSSGSSALDREALLLPERAQPLPPPPPEMAHATITVPIDYSIR